MAISNSILFFLIAISFRCFLSVDTLLPSKLDIKSQPVCSDIEVTDKEGIITSPNYPSLYPRHLSCSWHILGNVGDVITLWFDDVDIEESCSLLPKPCCVLNWLKVGLLANNTEKKVCGRNFEYQPIVSNSHKLWIKFHISNFMLGGRGFQLHYKIASKNQNQCEIDEIRCDSNRCVPKVLRCNGFADCKDRTDEYGCISPVFDIGCKADEYKCGDGQCIPAELRCNKVLDCEDGSDEHYCFGKCSSGHSCDTVFQCYNETQRCDGKRDCPDYSDELGCGFCQKNFIRCGANSTQCYNPYTQKCDKFLHCFNGEDEKDCDHLCLGKILCSSGRGCYLMKHRCNGVAQCEDASDEKNCVPELCNYEHGGFLCDNKLCIQQVWTCDHRDDCGDGSDEKNCLRNSVLTAAVIGSLICALLLVIAISCTCRLHALRMLEHRLSARETPLSRMSREYFFREPPPSYAVAVQGSQHQNLYVENLHYDVPVHRSRRRSRRPRHSRNSVTVPQLPSVPNNCVLVNPDGTLAQPEIVDASSTGESSILLHSDSPSDARPEGKNDCIPASEENRNICIDTATDDKETVVDNVDVCPVIRPTSENENSNFEPMNVFVEETSDSVQNVSSDYYCCDSDSEPLVP